MLRRGDLDISPSSSIEYLRNKERYLVLPWFSISSLGPIKSILLFSGFPISELGGKTIAVTSDSETSVALLKIILKEFLSLKCRFKTISLRSVRNILSSYPAVLHIGDTAMIEAKKLSTADGPKQAPFIYDLGELWDRQTGLPFVYALWVVRRDALRSKGRLIRQLSSDLIDAKKYASENLRLIAGEAPQKKWIGERDLISYWNILSYDFTERHMQGLKLFEKYEKSLEAKD